MLNLPRNVWVLTVSFALFMTLNVMIVFIGGIIGHDLAPIKTLSTLPIAIFIIGTAINIYPATYLMSKIGRRKAFLWVCLYTIVVIGVAILALYLRSFYMFCLAILLLGLSSATMNQFRFAAIESVEQKQAASATAMVLLGGLISAFMGPEIAMLGKDYFTTKFIGSFALLGVLFAIAFVVLQFFNPVKAFVRKKSVAGRSITQIIKNPVFIIAASSAIIGYVIMSYIMTATPVSMNIMHNISLEETKLVIQLHVVAMFLPSLFTAKIVAILGIKRMMFVGLILYSTCIVIAYSGYGFINYLIALMTLGIGWNFLFIGGTILLPKSYNEDEKYKVQALNDSLVFGMQAFAALSSGWVVFTFSWHVALLSTLPLLILQLLILTWGMRKQINWS